MGANVSYLRGTVGPSGYGSSSTAEDVTAGMDLSSKTIIITGATSGIGKECTRVLAMRGAHVILAVRNVKLGEAVCEEIYKETPKARLTIIRLDLNSLTSVREFAAEFKSRNLPLNILINNAGLVYTQFLLSEDGIEQTFAINHIGHFLLTNLLLDNLKATAKESGEESRIVTVSSMAHTMAGKNLDLNEISNPKSFGGFHAYGLSKVANILHANELARRLEEEGANVTANSLHPGIMETNLATTGPFVKTIKTIFFTVARLFVKSVPQAAATSCMVATDPKLAGVTGKYYCDCNEDLPMPAARDKDLGITFWKFSEELIASKSKE